MDLSLDRLKAAVSLREQIHALEKRLSSLFGAGGTSSPRTGKRRRMSAASRAKIAAAARARWAQRRGGSADATASPKKRRRSGITAEGRRKLSEAMTARWAARRKAAGRK